MFEFLLFAAASVGLTAILVDGKIFAFLRDHLSEKTRLLREKRERLNLKPTFTFSEFLEGVLSCYQCCGFWSGLLCGLFLTTSFSEICVERRLAIFHTALLWFCCGVAGSLFAHVYYWCIELISALALLVKSKIPIDEHHHHAHSEEETLESD